MTDLAHLIQDLRAHAHEAPEHIRELMRSAATALDNCAGYVVVGNDMRLTDGPVAAPFPPPSEEAHADR